MSTTTTVSSGKSAMYGVYKALSMFSESMAHNCRRIEPLKFKELETYREGIGTENFKVTDLSTDVHTIADGFGFSKDNLQFEGVDDNETFQKLLDVLDMVFSAALVVPMDKIDDVKSAIKMAAQGLSKYVPDFKTIGKILAMAPGIAKYSKSLITFGESMDHAIDIINRGGDDCIRQAIKELRNGIDAMRDVDIIDINKQVKDAKIKKEDAIEAKVIDIEDVKTKNEEKKEEKKEKKKEQKKSDDVIEGNSEATVAGAVAMSQQMMPGMQPGYIPDQDGSLPSWMNADISKDPNRGVPEFIAQNDMSAPRMDPRQVIYAPVQQQRNYSDQRILQYPFVQTIQSIANSVGLYVNFELIVDVDNKPLLIFVRTFNSQAYLPDKSFIIDLGVCIDGRIGIWPCATQNMQYTPLESCNEVYRMYPSDSDSTKVNTEFITTLFQYGFSNLTEDVRKKNTLYGERMCEANRVFALISIPQDMDREVRNIIRGACIRCAPKFSKKHYNAYGRFRITDINPKTREFTITNEGMSTYFMGPVYPHEPLVINMVPEKDENGNFVSAGKKGGTDIKYNTIVNNLDNHPYIDQSPD